MYEMYAALDALETELYACIDNDVNTLQKAVTDIDLVFSTDEIRKRIPLAYSRLVKNKDSFASRISSCRDSCSLKTIDNEDEYFDQNIKNVEKALKGIAPEIFQTHSQPNFIRRLLSYIDNLQSMVDGNTAETNKQKQQIIGFAHQLIRLKAIKALENVPVEELNRFKEGYKVKVLRENGYCSLADIVRGNVYQMCGINGISAYVINQIKHSVEQIEQETEKTQKLRLSPDDRSDEADHLMCALYAYKRSMDVLDRINSRWKAIGPDITSALNEIETANNSVDYFFFTDEEKRSYKNAYHYLISALSSSEAKTIRELYDVLCSPIQVNVSDAWSEFKQHPIPYVNILEELVPECMGNTDPVYGLPEYLAKEIQDQCFFPDGLLCQLRPYQEWGVKYILHQEKVLLGDEMGLGKTVQAIASMVSLRNTGATHFIVICPASVVANWCYEITKKSKLLAHMYYGNSTARQRAYRDWRYSSGVLVASYENAGNILLYENLRVSLLVVDEAHYIKNNNAQRTQAVLSLCQFADRRLFMTGTALENRVNEMISLISMLQPLIAKDIQNISFLADAPQFRERVAPVYYRRKREQVLSELPQLIVNTEWCTLGPVEEKVYEDSVCSKAYAEARRVSWIMDDMNLSCKAKRLKELVEEVTEDNRKIIVFSFFLDTLEKVRRLLGSKCTAPITGATSSLQRQQIIEEFENAPAGTVLPAQIISGGTGLNIQAASVVIICEPQLKPSIENQAISRAYRMGQTRSVLVYRLLCSNTVDERVQDLLEEKQQIFDAFADRSVAGEEGLEAMEVDNSTFGDIIKAEIERIKNKNLISSN